MKKKIVVKIPLSERDATKLLVQIQGVSSTSVDKEKGQITVVGKDVDPVAVIKALRNRNRKLGKLLNYVFRHGGSNVQLVSVEEFKPCAEAITSAGMRKVKFGTGSDEEDQVEESITEDEVLPDEDGQGDLSAAASFVTTSITEDDFLSDEDGQGDLSAAVSFVTARLSFSVSSPSSSPSSPAYSPSYTPLDQRAIGRAIEVHVDYRYLPFTYEEWHGHPQPTATR